MKDIVFNEKKQIETIIESKIPIHISIKNLLLLLVKYYYDEYHSETVSKYKSNIQDIVHLFDMPIEYEDYKYDSYIEKLCRNIKNGKLNKNMKQITYIPITELEMNLIKSLDNDREKKLLFTLYVLAKSVLEPTGWINYTDSQILEYGNLKGCSHRELHYMIHDLYIKGFLGINHKIGSSGYKVDLDIFEQKEAMRITDFKNFGNQCMAYIKTDWKMCENCGRMIKIKSSEGRPQKYCKKCGAEIQLEQMRKANKIAYYEKKSKKN